MKRIKNLFGLNQFPQGRHIYSYILDLTQEERSEFINSTKFEKLFFNVAMVLCLLAMIFIAYKVGA